MAKASSIPVIASGGITNMDDIVALNKVANQGILGAITGRAIYEGTLDVAEAQRVCDEGLWLAGFKLPYGLVKIPPVLSEHEAGSRLHPKPQTI